MKKIIYLMVCILLFVSLYLIFTPKSVNFLPENNEENEMNIL